MAQDAAKGIIDEKILICGVCKNVAKTLPQTLEKIKQTGELFRDYGILIYENNSTDNTKSILSIFHENNREKTKILSQDFNDTELLEQCHARTWDNQPCRMERIAIARNKILVEVFNRRYEDCTYVMWVDLDVHIWDLKGVQDTFRYKDWDCITANGITMNGKYRDAYAFRDLHFPFGPEILGDIWWKKIYPQITKKLKEENLIPVSSAFGSMAFYKKSSIYGCTYSGVVNEELHYIIKNIIENNQASKNMLKLLEKSKKNKVLNGVLQGVYLYGNDIFYTNNSGYNFPVCCEHVTFHASMIKNGFNKIYINPRMKVIYDL